MPLTRLFIYGTLKRGHSNESVMERIGAQYEGEASVNGAALLTTEYFPGMVPQPESSVIGQSWLVDEEGLSVLDYFEGVPHLFYREEVDIMSVDSSNNLLSQSGYAYFYNNDKSKNKPKVGLGQSWPTRISPNFIEMYELWRST